MTSGFLSSLIARNSGRISQIHPRMTSVFETIGHSAPGTIREETRTLDITPHSGTTPPIRKDQGIPSTVRDHNETRYIGEKSMDYTPGVPIKAPKDDTTRTGIASGNTPGKRTQKPPQDKETYAPVNGSSESLREHGPGMGEPRVPIGIQKWPDRESGPTPGAEKPVLPEISRIKHSRKGKILGSPDSDQERQIFLQDAHSDRDASLESSGELQRQFPINVVPDQVRPDSASVRNPDARRQRTELKPSSIRPMDSNRYTSETYRNQMEGTTAVKEPTIHVTIGRIEVRAMPPLTPRQKEPVPRAPTPLDEYLKRRDRGD